MGANILMSRDEAEQLADLLMLSDDHTDVVAVQIREAFGMCSEAEQLRRMVKTLGEFRADFARRLLRQERDGKVEQEMFSIRDGVREKILRQVLDTQEQQIKEALITLGWTPPGGMEDMTPEDRVKLLRAVAGEYCPKCGFPTGDNCPCDWDE